MALQTVYRIVRFKEVYTKTQGRRTPELHWLSVPIDFDTDGWCATMSLGIKGVTLYGIFHALRCLSAKLPSRGVLATTDGPIDARYFASRSRTPVTKRLYDEALEWFSSERIGWLKAFRWDFDDGLPPEDDGTGSDTSDGTNSATGNDTSDGTGSDTSDGTSGASLQATSTATATKQAQAKLPSFISRAPARSTDSEPQETAHGLGHGMASPGGHERKETATEALLAAQNAAFTGIEGRLPGWLTATPKQRGRLKGMVFGVIADAWSHGGIDLARQHVCQFAKLLEAAVCRADPSRRDAVSNPIGIAKAEFNRWRNGQGPPLLKLATA